MQKLTRLERKALARAADVRAARPMYAAQTRGPATVAPCRGKDINGAFESRTIRGRRVEMDLPSPCDARDRAAFNALYSLRDAEWSYALETARAESVRLRAHHAR